MKKIFSKKKRSGQAMLIAVLSLGGAILGATTIAGFLTLYQIQSANDSAGSAKAIFAADSGTEWALFNYYCSTDIPARCSPNTLVPMTPFANSSTVVVNCYNTDSAIGSSTLCDDPSTMSAISTGMFSDAERAFYVSIAGATTTLP